MTRPHPVEGTDPNRPDECICPHVDGRECATIRHGFPDPDGYECPCACHDIYQASLKDEEDAHDGD